jgi:hypothetical protein
METEGKHDRPTDRLPDKQTVTHVTELFSAALVYFDIHSMDYWELNFVAVTVNCLPRLCEFLPWHLPYNCGKSTEKPQSG